MLEFDYTWSFAASTGGGTGYDVSQTSVLNSIFMITSGAGSSAVVSIQSALSSGGPWFTEASTSLTSTSTSAVMRLTGPFVWLRTYSNSTGVTVRGIGVS